MATTNLNIRIDRDLKEQAEQIFNELGLNMTTAINVFSQNSRKRARDSFLAQTGHFRQNSRPRRNCNCRSQRRKKIRN